MARFWKNTLKLLTGSDDIKMPNGSIFSRPTMRSLVQRESELGGSLFGIVPTGHHRQFFNLDDSTWVWYEDWLDEKGHLQSVTTRYEVHANGILKVQDKTPYYYIEGSELDNFVLAVQKYYERVARDIYGRNPATAAKLPA